MTLERVLIVEDKEAEAKLLSQAFQGYIGQSPDGQQVAPWVPDLGAALNRLASESFSVVVLDLALSEQQQEEGIRVLRFLRGMQLFQPSEGFPPVVVLTARYDIDICKRAMQAGAVDYVLKGTPDNRKLDEATIDRVFVACEAAVRREKKLERRDIDNWCSANARALRQKFGGNYLAVFPGGVEPQGTEQLANRAFFVFRDKNDALERLARNSHFLDHDLHIAYVGKPEGNE